MFHFSIHYIMKTNLFLLGMAVAALASCTKSEVTDLSSKAIGFEPIVNNPTKAIENDDGTTNKNLSEFYVYGGSQNSQNLFNGEKVYKGNDWQYDNIKYWVEGSTYKFAAIYPGANDNNLLVDFDYASGHMKLEATVDNANQYDLVYAEQGPITITAENISTQPTVSFALRHILSKLRFVFTKNIDFGKNTQLIISDFQFSGNTRGILNKATYAYTTDNFGWTPAQDASDVIFAPNQTYTVTDESIVGSATAEVGQTFYVIPQSPQGGFIISFTVQLQEKATLSSGEEWVNIGNPQTLTTKILSAQWAENNIYTYTIHLKRSNITNAHPIELAATVSDWGTLWYNQIELH